MKYNYTLHQIFFFVSLHSPQHCYSNYPPRPSYISLQISLNFPRKLNFEFIYLSKGTIFRLYPDQHPVVSAVLEVLTHRTRAYRSGTLQRVSVEPQQVSKTLHDALFPS
uniref:Uncharacterized protein n=1 Tax=Cacopsylla melanoneura TaxID=428564 RepID=A0A8D8TRD8_9HEMI